MNGATDAGQIHTAGKPARGYRSAIAGHRQQIRQRGRTDRIDRASPALFRQRLGRTGQLLALDDLGGAQPFEVVSLLRPAGHRVDCKAALGRIAIATDPTPPAAPVTAIGPLAGVTPWRSSAITASIAV